METTQRAPWGAQDALQLRRGLFRAITPNYVAVSVAQQGGLEAPLQHLHDAQRCPLPQSSDPDCEENCDHWKQEDAQQELAPHPREQWGKQYPEGRRLYRAQQQMLHEDSRPCRIPPQRGREALNGEGNSEEKAPATRARPDTAGRRAPGAEDNVINAAACIGVNVSSSMKPLMADPPEDRKLQRCSSSSSVTRLKHKIQIRQQAEQMHEKELNSDAPANSAPPTVASRRLSSEKDTSPHLSSQRQRSRESGSLVQQQEQSSLPVHAPLRQRLQPTKGHAAALVKAELASPLHAANTGGELSAPEPATDSGAGSPKTWLQSRTYDAFGAIVSQLIQQQKQHPESFNDSCVQGSSPPGHFIGTFAKKTPDCPWSETRSAIHSRTPNGSPTPCCSAAADAAGCFRLTSSSRGTSGPRPERVAPENVIKHTVVSRVSASNGSGFGVAASIMERGAADSSHGSQAGRGCDADNFSNSGRVHPTPAPVLSAAAAVGKPPGRAAALIHVESRSCLKAADAAFVPAGAAGCFPAESTGAPRGEFVSGPPAADASAAGSDSTTALILGPNAVYHAASRPATGGTLRPRPTGRTSQLPLQPAHGSAGCSGVKVRTFVDISSYTLDSARLEAVRDRRTAVEQGPLLLLFSFYSRVFSRVRPGNTCEEAFASRERFPPRNVIRKASTINRADRERSAAVASGKSNSGRCSKWRQASSNASQSSIGRESVNTGSSEADQRSCTASEIPSSTRTHTSGGSCEHSSISSSRTEGSSIRSDGCCGPAHWYSSTSKTSLLPLRASLRHLLHDPVSFAEQCFGLREAQAMVEHFSRYVPPFSVPPAQVEELWILVLLTSRMTAASPTGSPARLAECATAAPSDAARPLAYSFVPLSDRRPGSAVPRAPPPKALRAVARPAFVSAAGRRLQAAAESSPISRKNTTMTSSSSSSAAATAARLARPATSNACIPSSSSLPFAEGSMTAPWLMLSRCSWQLREERLNFLEFTAFFAAVVSMATEHASTKYVSSAANTVASSSSSMLAGTASSAQLVSPAAGQQTCRSVSVAANQPHLATTEVIAAQTVRAAVAGALCETTAGADTGSSAPAEEPQVCATASAHESGSLKERSAASNCRRVHQFMQRLGTANAVKRFLLEVYQELYTRDAAAPEKKQMGKLQNKEGRNTATEASVRRAAGMPSLAPDGSPLPAAAQDYDERKDCRFSLAARLQRAAHVGERSQEPPRRKTEEIRRHPATKDELTAALPKRCNSEAAVQLKDGVYRRILTCNTTSERPAAAQLQARPALPARSVSSSDDSASVAGDAARDEWLQQREGQGEADERCLRLQLRRPVAHSVKRHLWRLLPDRGTLQWLLQRYTFAAVAPIWLPFAALFVDMGVQRTIAVKQHDLQVQSPAIQSDKHVRPSSTQDGGNTDAQHCEMLLNSGQRHGVCRELKAPAGPCPKNYAHQHHLIEKISSVKEGCEPQVKAERTRLQHQSSQRGYTAAAGSAHTPSSTSCSVASDAVLGNSSSKGTTAGRQAVSHIDSSPCRSPVSGEAFRGKLPSAGCAIVAKNCSTGNVARVDPTESSRPVSATGPRLPASALVSPARHTPIPSSKSREEASTESCSATSQTALASADPLVTSASVAAAWSTAGSGAVAVACAPATSAGVAGTSVTSTSGGVAAARVTADSGVCDASPFAPRQPKSDTWQGVLTPAGETPVAVEPADAVAPAAEAQEPCRKLPLPYWQLVQQSEALERQRQREHAAVLQARAQRKARRHRFAIEAENRTTTPVLATVNFENLPPVRTADGGRGGSSLLLVPGCSKRIILDVDRTHKPGEWLGFAHLRLRFKGCRSSALSAWAQLTRTAGRTSGRGGGAECRSRSPPEGCCNSHSSDIKGDRKFIKGGHPGLISPAHKNRERSVNRRNQSSHGSIGKARSGRGDVWFSEKVLSIPIYLRLLGNQEEQRLVRGEVSHPHAGPQVPVALRPATSTAPAAPGTRVCTPDGLNETRKRKGQQRARPLSPLPLYANKASLAAVLRCAPQKNHVLQSSPPCAVYDMSVEHSDTQCQKTKQQVHGTVQQSQSCSPQQQRLRQLSPSAPKPMATEGGEVVSIEDGGHSRPACISEELQQPRCLSSDDVQTAAGRRLPVDAATPPNVCARKMSLGEQRPRTPARTVERTTSSDNTTQDSSGCRIKSKEASKPSACSPAASTNKEYVIDTISNSGSSEDNGELPSATDSTSTTHEDFEDACRSPLLSVTSSSSEDLELNSDLEAELQPGSACSLLSSTGRRLNRREYSFVYRAETLERLQQAVPDCYYQGQQFLHKQQRLKRQYVLQRQVCTSQNQLSTQPVQPQQSDEDPQPQHCGHHSWQSSKRVWPQQQHIRWLRGHLLYGKDPMERKGWATREAAAILAAAAAAPTTAPRQRKGKSQPRKRRQEIPTPAEKALPYADVKETPPAPSPAFGEVDTDCFYSGKHWCTSPLFHYDTTSNETFRCPGCGTSFWGKYKGEAEEDLLMALRNRMEEELREASTASCSTSVPLAWALQQQ